MHRAAHIEPGELGGANNSASFRAATSVRQELHRRPPRTHRVMPPAPGRRAVASSMPPVPGTRGRHLKSAASGLFRLATTPPTGRRTTVEPLAMSLRASRTRVYARKKSSRRAGPAPIRDVCEEFGTHARPSRPSRPSRASLRSQVVLRPVVVPRWDTPLISTAIRLRGAVRLRGVTATVTS